MNPAQVKSLLIFLRVCKAGIPATLPKVPAHVAKHQAAQDAGDFNPWKKRK